MSHRTQSMLIGLSGVILWAGTATAFADKDLSMHFYDATNTEPTGVQVTIQLQAEDGKWGTIYACAVDIPANATATEKRDLIKAAIKKQCPAVGVTSAYDADLTLSVPTNVPARLRFDPGKTGERVDRVICDKAVGSSANFANTFDPFDYHHQPAVFTAGIVTDVGELTCQVSAQELNFQTDGPIICQALFQRLAPRAPQYGAQINYAGDRLEIYFDPAYTVTQGGVIFGTTSTSPGCSGETMAPAVIRPGDMNCDGVVDFADIDPFVLALTSRAGYEAQYPNCNWINGDCNGDGTVDFADIDPFVALLTG